MYCDNCGAELRDGAKFCTNCGQQTGSIEIPLGTLSPSTTPPANGISGVNIDKARFYISLGISALIIILFFFNWIAIMGQGLLYSYGFANAESFTVFSAIKTLISLADVAGNISADLVTAAHLIATLFALMLLLPVLNAVYFVFLLQKGENAYRFGKKVSLSCSILTALFIALVLICNQVITSETNGFIGNVFQLKEIPYVLLCLSIINTILLWRTEKTDEPTAGEIAVRKVVVIVGYILALVLVGALNGAITNQLTSAIYNNGVYSENALFIARAYSVWKYLERAILCGIFFVIFARRKEWATWLEETSFTRRTKWCFIIGTVLPPIICILLMDWRAGQFGTVAAISVTQMNQWFFPIVFLLLVCAFTLKQRLSIGIIAGISAGVILSVALHLFGSMYMMSAFPNEPSVANAFRYATRGYLFLFPAIAINLSLGLALIKRKKTSLYIISKAIGIMVLIIVFLTFRWVFAALTRVVAVAEVITAILNGIFLFRTKNKLGGHTKYNCI